MRRSRCSAWIASPSSVGVGAHVLRHTSCTHLANSGAPLDVIRQLAGHADIRTTTIYTAVHDDRLQGAIDDAQTQTERGRQAGGAGMTAPLDPTTAERLSRLRLLLNDAQNRVGDESPLGEHLAVIALDGVGELAIGLCVHERSLKLPRDVPAIVKLLRDDLGTKWAALGLQGFNELHRARNLVQHQGVLPAAEQLGRWAAETETFVRDLVSTVFGVELRHVSSALGISDPGLRDLLHRADRALDVGDARLSFDLSWEALGVARNAWKSSRGSGTPIPSSPLFSQYEEFREVRSAITNLAEQLEIGTFSFGVSEWVWMHEQRAESATRSPPTEEDARRALVFVTDWILRFESYSARYPAQRWQEWRDKQLTPRTGVPGPGPRILDAVLKHDDSRHSDKSYWQFIIADLPANDDAFMSAVSSASFESREEPTSPTVSLGLRGELTVAAPADLSEEQLLLAVRHKLTRASEILDERGRAAAKQAAREEQLATAYSDVFSTAASEGAPFGEVRVRLGDEQHPPRAASVVSVALDSEVFAELDYWNALTEVMKELGLDPAGRGFSAMPDKLYFSISWPPEVAVEWATKGLVRAHQRREEREAAEADEQRRREATVRRMRVLLGGERGAVVDEQHGPPPPT